MIVTEEEAKTKLCCESMLPTYVLEEATGRDLVPGLCQGSACMAWRWGEVERNDVTGKVLENVAGYCGKAGKP